MVPIAIDDEGLDPGELERAPAQGLDALVVTPHGQNPFGASLNDDRAGTLRAVIGARELLLVEDAHGWEAEPVADALAQAATGRSLIS